MWRKTEHRKPVGVFCNNFGMSRQGSRTGVVAVRKEKKQQTWRQSQLGLMTQWLEEPEEGKRHKNPGVYKVRKEPFQLQPQMTYFCSSSHVPDTVLSTLHESSCSLHHKKVKQMLSLSLYPSFFDEELGFKGFSDLPKTTKRMGGDSSLTTLICCLSSLNQAFILPSSSPASTSHTLCSLMYLSSILKYLLLTLSLT